MHTRVIARFALREIMGVLLMAVALFWAAGELAWWAAWALIAVTSVWILATGVVILRIHPDLLAERLGPRRGSKRWDTAIMAVKAILQVAVLLVAGLDRRYGWSGDPNGAAQLVALSICGLGYSLVVWATASNAFFSQIVRIQLERGHTVVTGGPYGYVRHPAYAGGVLVSRSVNSLSISLESAMLGSSLMWEVTHGRRPAQGSACSG